MIPYVNGLSRLPQPFRWSPLGEHTVAGSVVDPTQPEHGTLHPSSTLLRFFTVLFQRPPDNPPYPDHVSRRLVGELL